MDQDPLAMLLHLIHFEVLRKNSQPPFVCDLSHKNNKQTNKWQNLGLHLPTQRLHHIPPAINTGETIAGFSLNVMYECSRCSFSRLDFSSKCSFHTQCMHLHWSVTCNQGSTGPDNSASPQRDSLLLSMVSQMRDNYSFGFWFTCGTVPHLSALL